MRLAPENPKINEFEVYTPSSMRALESSTSNDKADEKEADPLFSALFIMAQIGGFYSFLKLVFGSILALFIPNFKVSALLNTLRYTRAMDYNKNSRCFLT